MVKTNNQRPPPFVPLPGAFSVPPPCACVGLHHHCQACQDSPIPLVLAPPRRPLELHAWQRDACCSQPASRSAAAMRCALARHPPTPSASHSLIPPVRRSGSLHRRAARRLLLPTRDPCPARARNMRIPFHAADARPPSPARSQIQNNVGEGSTAASCVLGLKLRTLRVGAALLSPPSGPLEPPFLSMPPQRRSHKEKQQLMPVYTAAISAPHSGGAPALVLILHIASPEITRGPRESKLVNQEGRNTIPFYADSRPPSLSPRRSKTKVS